MALIPSCQPFDPHGLPGLQSVCHSSLPLAVATLGHSPGVKHDTGGHSTYNSSSEQCIETMLHLDYSRMKAGQSGGVKHVAAVVVVLQIPAPPPGAPPPQPPKPEWQSMSIPEHWMPQPLIKVLPPACDGVSFDKKTLYEAFSTGNYERV